MSFLAYASEGGEGGDFGASILVILLLVLGFIKYIKFKNKSTKYKAPNDTRDTTNVMGWLLIIGGIIALVYSLSMDTSVSNSSGGRIHNIGLMNEKQNFVIVSSLILLIGIIITIFRRLKSDSDTLRATIAPETKQCPYCAEEIKPEALICRYCDRKQPQEETKDNRILCPDQLCIGIIDTDGRCSECGKLFKVE